MPRTVKTPFNSETPRLVYYLGGLQAFQLLGGQAQNLAEHILVVLPKGRSRSADTARITLGNI